MPRTRVTMALSSAERGRQYRARHPERCRAYDRLYRKRHPERVNAAARAYRGKNRAIMRAAKNVPCADCGGRFPPCVMDFDHVRGDKLFHIGSYGEACAPQKLKAEIAKCEVVCANCHRIRHHGEEPT